MTAIRKIVVNILLVAVFACFATAIIAPLAAEIRYGEAKRLVTQFLWNDAEKAFEEAIKVDPYSSQYPAEFAEFLRTQSFYKSHKTPYLTRAERLYGRALKLNPRNADYWTALGELKAELAIRTNGAGVDKAMDCLRRAVREDPNGFNVSYSAGYAGIYMWDYLSKEDKEFILDRLAYVIRSQPWYAEYICPRVLQKTKDIRSLERIMPTFRHDRKAALDNIRKSAIGEVGYVVRKSDWHGMSDDRKNLYEEGNMYWNGTIDAPINMSPGNCVIKIQAKGSPTDGVYPFMVVELDGINIGQLFIDSADWKECSFKVKTGGGVKVLSVSFVNDGGNAKEDRNLYIGEARALKDER